MLITQDLQQFLRAPRRVVSARFDDRLDELGRGAVGGVLGSTRTLKQRTRAFPQISIDPLVSGLAADAVAVAQFHYREGSAQDIGDELRLLFHE
jgi:hypothetical protein